MTPKDVQTAVHAALRAWGDLSGTTTDLLDKLLLTQQARDSNGSDTAATRRLVANQVLLNGIQLLQEQDPFGAQILNHRFLDGETVLMVAHKLNLSQDQLKRRQREAIRNLAQIIWEQETVLRRQRINALQAQLQPASYTRLFGIQDKLETLLDCLQKREAPWVVALVGIGGIGKTSLADAAARAAIDQFLYERVIWLKVQSTESGQPRTTACLDDVLRQMAARICPHLPSDTTAVARDAQLRQMLKAASHLVIIDNLESVNDTALFVNVLNDFANPSRFLLTTRARLSPSSAVYNLPLAQLTLADTIQLIRSQAKAVGLNDLFQADTDDLAAIYHVTGGNPLAIKLVVGLATVLPLPQVLADLTRAQSAEIEQMYCHIYWQAWQTLSSSAQTLLEMMPLAAGIGVRPEQMKAMSGLPEEKFWPAVAELANRSLLEIHGSIWERRYSIHRLTESFLRTEIIHWPEGR